MARKRNVQEQNALVFIGLMEIALRVTRDGLPAGASRFLAENGIDLASSAVVYLETASYMLGVEYGLDAFVVTSSERIWEIELELDESLQNVIAVFEFADVTETQNISQHNPGFGWGWGALAIEVMKQLNSGAFFRLE